MCDWIAVIILGIIEGLTEFLPISSTAHLLIAEHWLPRQSDLFNIVIQSGAVISVLPLFPERLHQFVFQWRERDTHDYAGKILLAFVITGIGGFVLDKAGFKLPEELWPIVWAILVGGISFLLVFVNCAVFSFMQGFFIKKRIFRFSNKTLFLLCKRTQTNN